ncbi:transporter [uncultured Sphingomonas sp.]|uniref:transporter n=1 Tax=uncultured Sphingomonas sp. TaxID=158754 RepID=UPI0030D95153
MRRLAILSPLALMVALPAAAQSGGDDGDVRFCPNRPSLGASGCTTLPGQVQVEMSGVDWTRDRKDGAQSDTLLYGDVVARIGVSRNAEVQVGWTPYGAVRTRDLATGAASRIGGTGDVTLGFRGALSHPDGKGLSAAVQPYVTLPVGGQAIGAGDWSAGMVLPVYYEIDDRWSIDFTGQAAAKADQDRHGRHVDVSGVVGLGYALSDAVTAVAELSAERDDDPTGATTQTLAAVSLAWQPTKRTQIDLLLVGGLNDAAPDARVVLGGAVAF